MHKYIQNFDQFSYQLYTDTALKPVIVTNFLLNMFGYTFYFFSNFACFKFTIYFALTNKNAVRDNERLRFHAHLYEHYEFSLQNGDYNIFSKFLYVVRILKQSMAICGWVSVQKALLFCIIILYLRIFVRLYRKLFRLFCVVCLITQLGIAVTSLQSCVPM